MVDKQSDNFKSHYHRGVGTDPGLEGTADALMPSADMRETANRAYVKFQDQATTWLKAHPEAQANPAESLQVMATGFSRGSGTAAVFSQMLHDRGLTDPATGKVLVSPGQLGLAGALALDPVTTAYDGNSAFSPTSQNITVVRANNEYRSLFKGVDHTGHPAAATVGVAGNHCDVGGGYDNGIAARVLEESTAWMKKAGVPISQVPPERRHDSTATVHHERSLPKPFDAADHPLTHDPKHGLHAPRQLTGAAKEETLEANGWKRFESAQGIVWRRDFPAGGGVTNKATVIEAYLPPDTEAQRHESRISVEIQGVGADGRAVDHSKSKQDGYNPLDVMRAVDTCMAQRAPGQCRVQGQGHSYNQSPAAEQPLQPVQHPVLHPVLQTLEKQLVSKGYTEEQAHKIGVYAQGQLSAHELATLKQAGVPKDGQTTVLVFRDAPLKELPIQEALAADGQRERAANAAAPGHAATPTTGTTPAGSASTSTDSADIATAPSQAAPVRSR